MNEVHFSPEDLILLGELFRRQRAHGHVEVRYAEGLAVGATLHVSLKPPLPTWIKVLATARADVARQSGLTR
jgi:hypothetical protein